jgi:hypothetical protein
VAEHDEVLIPRRLDGLEAALLRGEVVDQNFKPVTVDKNMANVPPPHILSADEQKGHKGQLRPGEQGWIELDVSGKPVGAATKFPRKDVPQAPVSTIVENTPSVLSTPAGAFLTDGGMNPSPAAYKYASSAYNRDYAPFAKRSMEKWGLLAEAAPAAAPHRPAGKAA